MCGSLAETEFLSRSERRRSSRATRRKRQDATVWAIFGADYANLHGVQRGASPGPAETERGKGRGKSR